MATHRRGRWGRWSRRLHALGGGGGRRRGTPRCLGRGNVGLLAPEHFAVVPNGRHAQIPVKLLDRVVEHGVVVGEEDGGTALGDLFELGRRLSGRPRREAASGGVGQMRPSPTATWPIRAAPRAVPARRRWSPWLPRERRGAAAPAGRAGARRRALARPWWGAVARPPRSGQDRLGRRSAATDGASVVSTCRCASLRRAGTAGTPARPAVAVSPLPPPLPAAAVRRGCVSPSGSLMTSSAMRRRLVAAAAAAAARCGLFVPGVRAADARARRTRVRVYFVQGRCS